MHATENANIELCLNHSFGVKKMSTSDVDKTYEVILKKIAELNRLLTSVIPPEQKKTISNYVQIMIRKVTGTAFDLMGKTVSIQKDLGETREELMKEVISSWGALVEKYEELSLYMSPVATASIWIVIDRAMELGMKIGALSATGTIEAKAKAKKELIENLTKTAHRMGYIA